MSYFRRPQNEKSYFVYSELAGVVGGSDSLWALGCSSDALVAVAVLPAATSAHEGLMEILVWVMLSL